MCKSHKVLVRNLCLETVPACCLMILLSLGTEELDGCTHGTEAVTLTTDVTPACLSLTDARLFRSGHLAICDLALPACQEEEEAMTYTNRGS